MDDRGPLPMAKRRAGGQMTKDDFDQGDDDAPSLDPGQWQPADEETLKKRKIIKARRGGAMAVETAATAAAAGADEGQGAAAPAASSNPFGGISLSAPAANPFAGVSLAAGAGGKPFADVSFAFNKADAGKKEQPADKQPEGKQPAASQENADTKPSEAEPAGEEQAAADAEEEQKQPAAAGFGGFGGFGSGLKAGGFGGFGGIAAGGFGAFGASTPADKEAEPNKPMFSFNTGAGSFANFNAPALASNEGEAAVFGSGAAPEPKPIVHLEEQARVTGEEEEQLVFSAPSGKLFEFDKGSTSWKLRGDGEFRINLDQKGQARMVMRQRGNLRLILNAKLFPQMSISHMVGNNKAATFACINAVSMADLVAKGEGDKEGEKGQEKSEGEGVQPVLKTWAVAIKNADKVNELIEVVGKYKGAGAAAAEAEPQV